MKFKKIVSILCMVSIVLMNVNMPAHAEGLSDTTGVSAETEDSLEMVSTEQDTVIWNDMVAATQAYDDNNPLSDAFDVSGIASSDMKKIQNMEFKGADIGNYSLDSATSLGIISRMEIQSANSITQSFTDFITAEGDAKFVQFSLAEGEILNASLACPTNANLDYDLALVSVAEDGSLTLISASNLGTYIDPDTGKTVDEGVSYVHNQATVGNFAVLVIATIGSSSVDSFTLTISIDVPGSYDNHEPNDSPFTATRISSLSANGSLHVVNDQDWYVVSTKSGVYYVTAGDYQAEVYYATEGNKMVRAKKANNNYVLGNGTYYIRVFSDVTRDKFTFGNYTLQMVDQSKYATMQTAFDFGDWEHSYMRSPDVIPRGQQVAYYKFTIDSEDKAYASLIVSGNESGTLIEFLDNNGNTKDYGFSGNPNIDLPVRGLIKKSNSSLSYLVVNIDGYLTNSTGYIRVTKVDSMDIFSGGTPSLMNRIYSGYDTFRFSGTAKNSGGSISNVLTLDLTNNSKIPPKAIVDEISTSSSISYNVGGVYHQLNPGGKGWFTSKYSNATNGDFDFAGYNIEAKQPWQFRYSQSALKSTQMTRVEMKIYWKYDIQYTNYELFK